MRAVFALKNGAIRFVVEHQAEAAFGFCHIYSERTCGRCAMRNPIRSR